MLARMKEGTEGEGYMTNMLSLSPVATIQRELPSESLKTNEDDNVIKADTGLKEPAAKQTIPHCAGVDGLTEDVPELTPVKMLVPTKFSQESLKKNEYELSLTDA